MLMHSNEAECKTVAKRVCNGSGWRGVRFKPDTTSKVRPKAATSMRFEALGKVGFTGLVMGGCQFNEPCEDT
ncbi:MAG TPA: hypothetical protein VFS23_41370 [Vicinamibacterales bacterium]|nr:hypothetical protein [Vicinamibacterales bacterium]